jgi:hypothetical protein
MNSRWRLAFYLAVVCVLCVFHVTLKTGKIFANPTWDARDEVGQFWSEFAFQYGFAKFFAEHPVSEWGRLAHDRDVQHPDEINDWAEFTVAMDVPAGALFRWLRPAMPFHVWIVWYDCVVGSLTLFGLFLLARALWRSDFAGLVAAFLFAALYPSYGRTVKNLYLREDFALPLIVLALWATVQMWQEEKRVRWEIGAGLLWLAALASWHLTQFVLAVGVGATVLVYLGRGETPRRPWFVLTLLAGAVAVPVLRAKQFYLSPTMCALLALSLAVWTNGGRKRATMVFACWLVVLVGVSTLLRTSYGEYAHVYQMFFYKLRFLGVKPPEPARLPWEARCLWEGAFNTARLSDFWRYLLWCGPLAVAAVWIGARKEVWKLVFAVFVVLLVPLSWMVVRYFTFLAPAAAALAAGVAAQRSGWKLAAGVAAAWQLMLLNWQPLDRAPVRPEIYRPVVAWLRENTATNAVILSGVSESPVWWAYTGRATVLHSKFENERIRERYREFLAALYGTEAELAAFARKYGAEYFVYDRRCLDVYLDSWRYKANRVGELPAECVARRMAERPGELTEFRPEFWSERFAVFRMGRLTLRGATTRLAER